MKSQFIVIVYLTLIIGGLQAQKKEGYVENEEAKNFYQVWGKGKEAMLIINGGPGMNSQGFDHLAQRLAERYGVRTITYDQRGTGNSSLAEKGSITLDWMLSDMEAIREKENIEEWIVFGQSFGGMLASYYASEYPSRVSKLILSSSGGLKTSDLNGVDIMGRLTKAEVDSFNYWNQRLLNANDPDIRYQRNMILASAYLVGDAHIAQIARRLGQVNIEIYRLVFQDMRRSEFDCTEKLMGFIKPSLILIGDQDIVSLDAAKRTNEVLLNSELVIIPNSGHYGWLDNSEVYFEALDRLMNR